MKKIKKKKVTKVKRKVVKSKKVKKEVIKKKTKKSKKLKKKVKKELNKTKKKTFKRKKKRKKIFMQDVYAIINKVQLGKKKIIFVTDLKEAPVVENNIKDVELKYDKVEMKTQVIFTLYPDNKEYEEEILSLEIMDDEIPDIGQIFG